MKMNEEKGNLFELDSKYALAHCVSQDCDNPKSWGMGIVVEFNKRFIGMKDYCQIMIEENKICFPSSIMYRSENNQVVFNLITKKVYYGKPTYDTITTSIRKMAKSCVEHNIKYLAMPKIGCGLDRLRWNDVKQIIQEEFKDIDIEIEVRYL